MRLRAVINYLRQSDAIGTVDEPNSWIEDMQEAKLVYLPENDKVIMFIGESNNGTYFGLGGSAAHLVSHGKPEKIEIGWSFLPDLLDSLRVMVKVWIEEPNSDGYIAKVAGGDETEWMELLRAAKRASSGPQIRIKFLAKKLLAGTHKQDRFKGVMATPLYVSMSE
jgi:hypothetical protein